MDRQMPVYGMFPGGDPREFEPDEDCCSKEEIENHRLACEIWDKGEGLYISPQCQTMGDSSFVLGTGFGIGTYYIDENLEDRELRHF